MTPCSPSSAPTWSQAAVRACCWRTLLERCQAMGLLKAARRQRTDSTYVLERVRATTRLEYTIKSLHHALNNLALAAPGWLRDHRPSDGTQVFLMKRDTP